MPASELTVSPGHAMVIDGALVHAKYLLNGRTIVQYEAVTQVSYVHIELAAHEIIFAEGAPTETFMVEEFCRLFEKTATFGELYPGEQAAASACLPNLSGFALAAARKRLAARAGHHFEALCRTRAQGLSLYYGILCIKSSGLGQSYQLVVEKIWRRDRDSRGSSGACQP